MKKLFLLAFIATMSTAVFAQTTTAVSPVKQAEKKELRKDVKDLNQDEKQLKADRKAGDKTGAALERKDIQADKKDIRTDAKVLGIKHPARVIRNRRHH